ncbi:MAG: CoA-binding protein [Bacteroidota bacterium]|nr:CoA-binding protein [Bacteroidota bacterium]
MLQGIKIAENNSDIKSVLTSSRVIAVVGSSPSPEKDSYRITEFLIKKGYSEIPEKIDIVNIFRRPEFVLPVVEEAIQAEASVVWFQFGVGSAETIKYALDNEFTVVNDRCIKIEHMQLVG